MIPIEKCKLRPVPPLRAGTLSPDEVQGIAQGFVNFNPAIGTYQGLGAKLGWQSWDKRMTGRHVHKESTRRVWESLDEHGQVNPVLLWDRWGSLLISYGASRAMWAYFNRRPLKVLIVDYDNHRSHWRRVPYRSILKEFRDPPMGVTPTSFGWGYGEYYVITDAREWEFKTAQEWQADATV